MDNHASLLRDALTDATKDPKIAEQGAVTIGKSDRRVLNKPLSMEALEAELLQLLRETGHS